MCKEVSHARTYSVKNSFVYLYMYQYMPHIHINDHETVQGHVGKLLWKSLLPAIINQQAVTRQLMNTLHTIISGYTTTYCNITWYDCPFIHFISLGTSGVVEFTDIWCIEPYQMINFTVTATKQREVATLVRPFYPGTYHCCSCQHSYIV